MAERVRLAVDGGNMGIIMFAIIFLWKIKGYLDRYEHMNKDYPPHRHINGSRIVYPKEYQPAPVERLTESEG